MLNKNDRTADSDNESTANSDNDRTADVIATIDPRLNCASNICCPPNQARQTQIELLCEAGCPDDLAPRMADRLAKMGISLAPTELMDVIARLAQHPNAASQGMDR